MGRNKGQINEPDNEQGSTATGVRGVKVTPVVAMLMDNLHSY